LNSSLPIIIILHLQCSSFVPSPFPAYSAWRWQTERGGTADTTSKPTAIQGVFPLILFALLPFLPESPRYLLIKDRYEEASAVLHKLHTPDEAKVELAQIANQMRIDRTLPSSYWAMFKKPSYRKRSFLALGTTCGIACSGILGK